MVSFLPIFGILILILVPIIMVVIRIYRPDFAYFWLVAAVGALLVWPLILLSQQNIPLTIPMTIWSQSEALELSIALGVDGISWPFALTLATLVLSVVLTDVSRAAEADWAAWSGSLTLTALGLIAVLAGNPLTLILAWAAIDLIELCILLWYVGESAIRGRIVLAFAARAGGIWLLITGMALSFLSDSTPSSFEFQGTPSLLVLLSAGLRLGVIPFHVAFLSEIPLRRGLGTVIRLVPAGASLVLLARIGNLDLIIPYDAFLLGLTSLATLIAAISWFTSQDELDGRPYWILGMASLAMAAAIRGSSLASLAWGIALILSGGLLFLYSARNRALMVIPVIGLIGFSGLPFSPLWSGMYLYQAPFTPFLLIFIIAHSIFMLGYLNHALQPAQSLIGVERWVWVIYPWGLILLPLALIIVSLSGGWMMVEGEMTSNLNLILASVVIVLLTVLLIFFSRRGPQISFNIRHSIRMVFSLDWLYRVFWGIYRIIGAAIGFLNAILEGDGGILWAFLLLVLILAFIVQTSLGGI